MFLVGILITSLYSYLTETLKANHKIENAKTYTFKKHHAFVRLNQIFSQLLQQEAWFENHLYFDSKANELNFLFDNGIDPNPKFSGPVYGKLYVSKEHSLCLNIYPLEKDESFRKESILSHVENLNFLFFNHEDKVWKDIWDAKNTIMPIMIKLSLVMQKETVDFAFFPSSYQPMISYRLTS